MKPADKRKALDALIKLMRDKDVQAILLVFRQDERPKSEREILDALPPNGMTLTYLSPLLEKMQRYSLVIRLADGSGKWSQGETSGFMHVLDPRGHI